MNERITIESIKNIPYIRPEDDLASVIAESIAKSGIELIENDVICVASKVVSITENRQVSLTSVNPSEVAKDIKKRVPRKDERTIQLMLNETGKLDGSRLEIQDNYIAGWLPNGLRLTSAGIDKLDNDTVILLPENSNASAKIIGQHILDITGINVGVVITDSDGRADKKGATQLAIGVYGVPPLRITQSTSNNGDKINSEETLCDMIAASAALIMGQRGVNRPAVIVRGLVYQFDPEAKIEDALNKLEK